MGEEPPYLIEPGESPLSVTADRDGSFVDVTVTGHWTAALQAAVGRTLRNCLAERPAGIVVDLHGLVDPAAASVPTWVSAAGTAADAMPAVHLALCLPPDSALASALRSADCESVLDTPEEARAALTENCPPAEVIRLRLAPSPMAPCEARNLVGDACHEWDLQAVLHPGRAVMSELVANAVEHARTDMDIAVSRRGTALHLVVRDRTRQLPRIIDLAPVEPGLPLDERGHGLRVVHADSTAWGAIPVTDGKMVWATVRDRAGRRRRW
ncbi:ATP-binding protein [Couchioplanes caeruleus]|uniref:ATP-binding protein n=1 Tax=Couchioplanes caeruleus TaxID=56438 RepID=UPI0020BDA933|nr:ATP-binding protein [Couchioplanes caeruleus]UQU63714.1 ATP-binding protein [Couchioplanes caeruleus]